MEELWLSTQGDEDEPEPWFGITLDRDLNDPAVRTRLYEYVRDQIARVSVKVYGSDGKEVRAFALDQPRFEIIMEKLRKKRSYKLYQAESGTYIAPMIMFDIVLTGDKVALSTICQQP